MNHKKWVLGCLALTLFLLIVGALPTIIIDPFFHYHAPLEMLEYELDDQRHQNDGILKNFSYDAVITGTSMTDNFKATEFDSLFGVSSVKTAFPGGSYKEIADRLTSAFRANPGIRYVIRSIDCNRIPEHKDAMNYEDALFPDYLYDWKLYNDVSYIFNKQVLFDETVPTLAYTRAGYAGTTFDEYNYWSEDYPYGVEAIKSSYARPDKAAAVRMVNAEDLERLQQSMEQNFLTLARANPDTEFYLFFTPYSIFWWDSIHQTGELEFYIQLMREASRLLVEQENIHLFSFFGVQELICDPNLYKDTLHYSGEINSQILQWMKAEEHRLTQDNYAAHWDAAQAFYSSYDYDALFQ